MKTREADELGRQAAFLAEAQQIDQAYTRLAPLLIQRIPFALLDRVGLQVGAGSLLAVNALLDQIAATEALGGFPIIGKALYQQFGRDPAGAFERCRLYILAAENWFVTDILGERLHGPALVSDFAPALEMLTAWRDDPNKWFRRSVGVGIHVWGKRARGNPDKSRQAGKLLEFLKPAFAEREIDAVKGIGWGIKTLGRYYPDQTADWLVEQVVQQSGYRALMLQKALTYLPPAHRKRIKATT